jgi:uncharacterized protein YgbK (DUF1537 family)
VSRSSAAAVADSAARAEQDGPQVCFYGDDFTGSTDALGQFARFGLRSLLLLQTPDLGSLGQLCSGFQVVGIAGVSRALPPESMDDEPRAALEFLCGLRPSVVQYKICSTFDSSPHKGSIGRALELGTELFGPRPVPVLAAQPEFGRYTVFGNHFAQDDGVVHRLDRHPTMSNHPSTPMREADLRRVLSEQTRLPTHLLNIVQLQAIAAGEEPASSMWAAQCPEAAGAVVVDSLTDSDLVLAAEVIMADEGSSGGPRFVIGSGGLSFGLAQYFSGRSPRHANSPRGTAQVIALSGSRSPQTERQIAAAARAGWSCVELDPRHLGAEHQRQSAVRRLADQVLADVAAGSCVAVHTGGQEGGGAAATAHTLAGAELAQAIGEVFGDVLDAVLRHRSIERVIIAGGDTSGFTLRRLDAYGLEVEDQVAPAGWLCRLRSGSSHLDGVAVVLKGGQVGRDDFFERVRRGTNDAH